MKYFKFKKYILDSKHRAVSPVIATVLLIGLVVIAGASFAVINSAYLSSQPSIDLEVNKPLDFSSTETEIVNYDELIDSFIIQVKNPLFEPIELDLDDTNLFNATDDETFFRWSIDNTERKPVLNGQETMILNFKNDYPESQQEEFKPGDDFYIVFSLNRINSKEETYIQSETFKIESGNSSPIFKIEPSDNSFSQDNFTVFFYAEDVSNADAINITSSLTVILWNYGSSSNSYSKTANLFLTNETLFSMDSSVKTQSITIPSSNEIGDANQDGICDSNEACQIITFPITKRDIVRTQDTYSAILSISGMKLISVNLTIAEAPAAILKLKDEDKNNAKFKSNALLFDKKFDQERTKTLKVIVWNRDFNNQFNGQVSIQGLNTTAFRLDTTPSIQTVTVDPGIWPGDNNLGKCKAQYSCTEIRWDITRLPVEFKNGSLTGVAAGSYTINVVLEQQGSTVYSKLATLIIPKDKKAGGEIFVDSIQWIEKMKNNQIELEAIVILKDEIGLPVKDAEVFIQWSDSGKGTDKDVSDKNGLSKYKDKNAKLGKYTITVTDIKHKDNKSGNWIYNPTTPLPTGSYTIKSGGELFVKSISWEIKYDGNGDIKELKAFVFIEDEEGLPVFGAEVDFKWTWSKGSDLDNDATNSLGLASSKLKEKFITGSGDVITVEIIDVTGAAGKNWVYNAPSPRPSSSYTA